MRPYLWLVLNTLAFAALAIAVIINIIVSIGKAL